MQVIAAPLDMAVGGSASCCVTDLHCRNHYLGDKHSSIAAAAAAAGGGGGGATLGAGGVYRRRGMSRSISNFVVVCTVVT